MSAAGLRGGVWAVDETVNNSEAIPVVRNNSLSAVFNAM